MATDERLKKSDETRTSREATDRKVSEDREMTDNDRIEMFRQQFFQSALPDLPKIPGFHTCWLTTGNPRDSIQHRLRLGYEPIKSEEIPGWEYATIKTGEYIGMVGVNEMLAFKLPLYLYEMYMREAHYDAPLREEEKLLETTEFLQQQARSSGTEVMVGDGLADMRVSRGSVRFDND